MKNTGSINLKCEVHTPRYTFHSTTGKPTRPTTDQPVIQFIFDDVRRHLTREALGLSDCVVFCFVSFPHLLKIFVSPEASGPEILSVFLSLYLSMYLSLCNSLSLCLFISLSHLQPTHLPLYLSLASLS